jgi:hypothetical protein
MDAKPARTATRNVRGTIPVATHKALKARQNKMEEDDDIRPPLTEVVAMALDEWAAQQQQKMA